MGDMTHSLANSVLSVSEITAKIATTIEVRQELIDDITEVLVATRKLMADVGASAETQQTLLPKYADTLKDASTQMINVGTVIVGVSDAMMFSVPTSLHRDGFKPGLNWTKPLERHAKALKEKGEIIIQVSGKMAAVAASLSIGTKKGTAEFINISKATLKFIDHATSATQALKAQDLPQAIAALRATAESLARAGAEAKEVERFANVLLAAGLILATLFAFNSVGVLLIVDSLKEKRNGGGRE
jgi:hypothetical protein